MTKQNEVLKSAKEFLIESLINYRQKCKINFAILHAVTATELLLKARLMRINENLIYKNIDAASVAGEFTVGLRQLPHRLANLGVDIGKDATELIKSVAEWRNEIVHFMPTFTHEVAKSHLAQLFNFSGTFLRTEFSTNLKTFLPKDLFKTVNGLMNDWQSIVSHAQKEAATKGNVVTLPCPVCNAERTMSIGSEGRSLYCHLCESTHEYGQCKDCERMDIGSWDPYEPDEFFCNRCQSVRIQYELDRHESLLDDIRRGK